MNSQAYIPVLIKSSKSQTVSSFGYLLLGVGLLFLTAQLSFQLPFSPVPITGQTFGVTFLALLWGSKRAFGCVASYLLIGGLGLPVFALSSSLLTFGPTMGYLIGMLISSYVVGYLADIGFTKTFGRSLLASYLGSFFVFICGVTVLSFYVEGAGPLFMAGVLPFLAGDLIKNTAASLFSMRLKKLGPLKNRIAS